MKTKIKTWEIIDHGVDHSQYFPGCGVSFSDFEEAITGSGSSQKEALTDAISQLSEGYSVPQELLNKVAEAKGEDEVLAKIEENLPELKFKVVHRSQSTSEIYHSEEFKELIDAQAYLRNRLNEFKTKFNAEATSLQPDHYELQSQDLAGLMPDWVGSLEILSNEERIEELRQEALDKNELYYYLSIRLSKEK